MPTLVVAPMFMRGEIEFGSVTQAGGAFASVLAAVPRQDALALRPSD